MEKFNNKYRIPSARWQNWDYSWNAPYFVTICTKYMQHRFGQIINHEMILSDIGQLANKYWHEIPNHFPFTKLDAFIIMPNHIHAIIIIDKPNNNPVQTRHRLVSNKQGKSRHQNQGKNTLSSIIGSYKSIVSKTAHQTHPNFAWQPRFHDHVIRNNEEHQRIKNYIINNPKKWQEDKFRQ